MTQFSRRRFLAHGGQTACLCMAGTGFGSTAMAAPSRTTAAKVAITPPLSQFRHGDVQLTDGPMHTQFEHQRQLFLNLDNDALLKPFRLRAGLPAPGADMGGWYDNFAGFHNDPQDTKPDMHGFIPGHSFGQYISGLSRGYAITGDTATKAKITVLVSDYTKTISPKFFEDYNLPAYTYDKLVVGLMDAWYYAGVTQAKPALARLTETALPFLPEKALNHGEMAARPHKRQAQTWDESYTLPENLFLAYQRGMGEQYKALAQRYIEDDTYFQPLSEGQSPLKSQHAYSHVNGLSSAMQTYLTLGDEKYLRAAANGFRFVEAQSYATGGWGRNETLLADDDHESLLKSLTDTHASFETPCGAYGHFKIARYLLRTTKDSHYGDSMERILYNTVLGARPTLADGTSFYYSDYSQSAKKVYYGDKWPCCSGTFIQLTTDYGISAYVFDADSLYVNLYVPSKVKAKLGGQSIVLDQATQYPAANTSVLTLSLAKPATFGLKLRIPAWAGNKTMVTINGQPAGISATPGTFADITRRWSPGDKVEIAFDMTPRLEPLNTAHPEMVALLTGPVVLFPVGDGTAPLSQAELLSAKAATPNDWRITAADRQVRLKPFTAIDTESYRLYSALKA